MTEYSYFKAAGTNRDLRRRRIREQQLKMDMPNEPKVYQQRELTDTSVFPFGKHKILGTKMTDVPMSYYRWFLAQDWHRSWPTVVKYAQRKLSLSTNSSQPSTQ